MTENSREVVLLQNMWQFLEFLEKRPAKLTQTKNLTLKWLDDFSKATGILGTVDENGFKRMNQQEWPEVDIAAVIAELAKLTMNRKGIKIITKKGRDYLAKDISSRTNILFDAYWNRLDWRYIFPYGEEDKNAAYYLQKAREYALGVLQDLDRTHNRGRIDFLGFSEILRKPLGLTLINHLGQDLPERVRACIRQVIIEMFEQLGLFDCFYDIEKKQYRSKEWEHKELKSFQITETGRRIISENYGENIPDRIMPLIRTNFCWN